MAINIMDIVNASKNIRTEMVEGLTVKTYLPYMDKVEFAADVLRNVVQTEDETGMAFLSFKEDLWVVNNLLKYYTDFPVDSVDAVDAYDYVKQNGLLERIIDVIGRDMTDTMSVYHQMARSVIDVNRQSISISQMIKGVMDTIDSKEFIDAMTNAKLESDGAVDLLERTVHKAPQLNFAKK